MKIKLFTQDTCPKCPAAKKLCKELESRAQVEYHDVRTEDGLAESLFFNVMSTPTIILEKEGKEIKSWREKTPTMAEVLEWLR